MPAPFLADNYHRVPPSGCGHTWELSAYLGWVAFGLFLASLRRGIRWRHIAVALTLWGCTGNDQPWQIMYWIQKLPIYESLRNYARIRMFTLFFAAIAVADELAHLRARARTASPRARSIVLAVTTTLGLVMAAEPALVSHITMYESHLRLPFANPNRPLPRMVSVDKLPFRMPIPNVFFPINAPYEAMKRNLGWLEGPHDAWLPEETACVPFGHPDYIAEFHQQSRPVQPIVWSPNYLRFENLEPGVPLRLNLNPGSPWYADGKQLFPDYRIVEMLKPFVVVPVGSTLELRYRPPGHIPGIIATAIIAIPALAIIAGFRRRDRRQYH